MLPNLPFIILQWYVVRSWVWVDLTDGETGIVVVTILKTEFWSIFEVDAICISVVDNTAVETTSVVIYWALFEFTAEGILFVEMENVVETLSEFDFWVISDFAAIGISVVDEGIVVETLSGLEF